MQTYDQKRQDAHGSTVVIPPQLLTPSRDENGVEIDSGKKWSRQMTVGDMHEANDSMAR